MSAGDWQPSATFSAIRSRARLLQDIRQFFSARDVLEVETPLLSQAVATDPNIEAFSIADRDNQESPWLQPSPEFSMKRLLAAGSGSIYQICKAFRQAEAGSRHNPEFTMLEWYRQGMSLDALMDEVEALVAKVTGRSGFPRVCYRDLFERHLDIDPFNATLRDLESLAHDRLDVEISSADVDTWLDLLFASLIEPKLKPGCFIVDYPASQAALARIEVDEDGYQVARRFELVVEGLELANGYLELTDAREQKRRFRHDLDVREARGTEQVPIDHRFLAALEHGLPACSGVALGVDRLLMIMLGARDIRDVLAFPVDRA